LGFPVIPIAKSKNKIKNVRKHAQRQRTDPDREAGQLQYEHQEVQTQQFTTGETPKKSHRERISYWPKSLKNSPIEWSENKNNASISNLNQEYDNFCNNDPQFEEEPDTDTMIMIDEWTRDEDYAQSLIDTPWAQSLAIKNVIDRRYSDESQMDNE
jgi:hypothetical protein